MNAVVENEDACEVVEWDFEINAKGDVWFIWRKSVDDGDEESLISTAEPNREKARADDDWGLDDSVLRRHGIWGAKTGKRESTERVQHIGG